MVKGILMKNETNLNLSMFKAYDIRTKSVSLNKEITNRLMRAFGRYFLEVLKCKSVVIARDARLDRKSVV